MKQRKLLYLMMAIALLPFFSVSTQAMSLDLNVGYVDPNNGEPEIQRSPVSIPEVDIDGYTLSFITPCIGCTLQLVDENGIVVYTTAIPNGATNLVLPSYLSGEFEIQIVQGYLYFYGFILL